MNNFTFQNPVKLIFGKGSIAKLAKEIPADKKIMVTFGGGSVKKNGVYDHCTDSMRYAIEQSNRRREKQMRYNMEHEMLPRQAQKSGSGQSTLLANTVQTPVTDGILYPLPDNRQTLAADVTSAYSTESIDTQIARAREEMERAAKSLDFLAATKFRDRMYELQKLKESEYKR